MIEQFFSCVRSIDCVTVTATDIQELRSTQEEADTRIILHCLYAAQHHFDKSSGSIVVRSPDTDVFVLLVYYSPRIHAEIVFETGTGEKLRHISVNDVHSTLGDDMAQALPAFHAFTGCDSTSSFVRRGKKCPLKNTEAVTAVHQCLLVTWRCWKCIN